VKFQTFAVLSLVGGSEGDWTGTHRNEILERYHDFKFHHNEKLNRDDVLNFVARRFQNLNDGFDFHCSDI